MDTKARLDELLSRASKISDTQAQEAARLLLSLCADAKEKAAVADYLMKFKPTVCLNFFESAINTLDPETQLQSIHSSMCSTEAYKKNANHAATSRGFIIAAIFIKNNVGIARAILIRTITDTEKDGKFSDAVINNFKQYVVEYCGSLDTIKALGEKSWKNKDSQNRFIRFMSAVDSSIVRIIPMKEQDIDDSGDGKSVLNTSTSPSSLLPQEPLKDINVAASDTAIALAVELIKTLSNASKEATTLTKSLSNTNGTISLLRKDIASRDSRITELSSTISMREHTIEDLERKLNGERQTIREKDERISDLSERLKNSLQMDNISQNQELITLKTNLQNSLRVEYSDYLASKEGECNPDTYGALLGSLARIFKTLRRYGVIID